MFGLDSKHKRMNLVAFSLVLTGVLLNAVAQFALKASVRGLGVIELSPTDAVPVALRLAGEPWLWLGMACYVVSVAVWILALSRVEVSIAYPMLSIGYIVNAVAAWIWLGETMSLAKIAGIAIITLGVLVLARS